MNQILITEKLYITPELKRQKKLYKIDFIISVFLLCLLFSYYIYAEYDKYSGERKAQEILANMEIQETDLASTYVYDDTTIRVEENEKMVVILSEQDDGTIIDTNNLDGSQTTYSGTVPKNVMTSESGDTYYSIAKINSLI